MSNLELINKINEYVFENNEKGLLDTLNYLMIDGNYRKYMQEVYSMISITEMYGYLAYLSSEEIADFLIYDSARSQTYIGKNINYYNKGQLSLLYDFENNKKVFLSAPTSFGKTSIVLEYILENYKILNNIMFIVPTNSLLEELYQKIIKLNKNLGMNYYISTQPHKQRNKRNFLLLTPERFFLVSETISINDFDLIVMDETYKIVDSKDEQISDFLESRALRFRKVADMIGSSNNRTIFLSPFTYSLTKSMDRFLRKYEIKKIDRKIEYVSRDIIKISSSQEFKKYFGNIKGYTQNLSKSKKVNYILEKLKKEKNIVYVSNYSEAYKIIDDVSFDFEVSHSERFNNFIKHLENNYDVGVKYEWKVITGLKKGIGIYVAPLPRYIKKEIIKLYEQNEIGTLIVTTAFTEGVNTNASNLIFTSLVNGPTTNKLSNIDVLNVSGRAGRFAKSSVGKIYCIDDNVYQEVNRLQKEGSIQLENYNYKIGNPTIVRGDYAIDMLDEEFLTPSELTCKSETNSYREKLELSQKDLNISLCVPTKWKLILYEALNNSNIEKIYSSCKNIYVDEPNKRVESLNLIFLFIRDTFISHGIDPFPSKSYEIRAFDNSGQFIWSRLYKIYCSGKSKDIIGKNISFIKSEYNNVVKSIYFNFSNKDDIIQYFTNKSKGWILNYYTKELRLNYDAFYTETFKFISSIVQYKIPFYVSFVTSIIKLYIQKKSLSNSYDTECLDSKKAALLFENGTINNEYEQLIDFGISNDIIIKLYENNISLQSVIDLSFNIELFDEYELIVLKEFSELMK